MTQRSISQQVKCRSALLFHFFQTHLVFFNGTGRRARLRVNRRGVKMILCWAIKSSNVSQICGNETSALASSDVLGNLRKASEGQELKSTSKIHISNRFSGTPELTHQNCSLK